MFGVLQPQDMGLAHSFKHPSRGSFIHKRKTPAQEFGQERVFLEKDYGKANFVAYRNVRLTHQISVLERLIPDLPKLR